MIREKEFAAVSGWAVVCLLLAGVAGSIWLLISGIRGEHTEWIISALVALAVQMVLAAGLFVVNPNDAKVLQLFGKYVGTARQPGLRFANPFFTKRRVSMRVRNFESARLKVNDLDGNPIEIAAVVVIEARISHLAYASEIAAAMLQRQQAGAIIAARQRIVDGAVGMVEMALDRLARNNVVELDEERKAAMVSNLLVLLWQRAQHAA